MAQVVTAPDAIPPHPRTVFLAGAIDMGEAENWQQEVIEAFKADLSIILVNPRRKQFTDDMEDEQIAWELEALEKANVILMWFPESAEAPVSFLELGLYLQSGKLLVGVEQGFYRQRNIELTSQRYGNPVYYSLTELITAVRNRLIDFPE
jgi:hypothetical protein